MKQIKIFLIVLSVLFSFIANAQSQPQTQSLGTNSNVQATVAGYFKALKGVAIPEYPDTTTANLDPYLKNLNGQTIKVGKSIYMRNTATKEWVIQRTVFADSVLYVQTPLVWNAQDTILYMTQANNTTNGWITAQNYIDWYNKADGPLNALLSTGGLTLADTTVTLHAPILWRFNGLPLSRVTDTSFKINRAPIGYKRLDAIYIDSLGVIRRKQGTADTANAALPILDYNAIPVTYIDVSGQVVTEPQVISLYQRTAVITVDPTTGKQTSDSLAMSMQTSGPQSHSLNIDKTAPPGTSSGVQLNNRRAEWYGNFNGSLFNVGGTLAGGGVFDVSKGYHFQNKGNDYLVINSTSNTNHLSKFLTKLAVTDIPDYLLTPTYVLTLDGDTIKKVAFPSINNTGWSLTGNTGINPSLNWIGTNDNEQFRIKTNLVSVFDATATNGSNPVVVVGETQGTGNSTQTMWLDGIHKIIFNSDDSIRVNIYDLTNDNSIDTNLTSLYHNNNADGALNLYSNRGKPLKIFGAVEGSTSDSLLSKDNTGTVKMVPYPSIPSGTPWKLSGNSVVSTTNFGTTSNFPLPFIINNTEKMRLTSIGLGLGLTNPVFPLDIYNNGIDDGSGFGLTQLNIVGNNTTSNSSAGIDIRTEDGGLLENSFGIKVTGTYNTIFGAGKLLVGPNDASGNPPPLTITKTYKVGINKIDPETAIHIAPVSGDLTPVIIEGLGTFADDTAAGVGGLTAGMLYKTSTGQLMIKL